MIAHFRPLLFVFISFLLGIYLGYVFCYVSSTIFYLSLIGCGAVVSLLLISIFCHLNNRFFSKIFAAKKPIICITTCFLIGATTFNLMYYNYQPEYKFEDYHSYYVVATVKTNYSYTTTEDYERINFLVKDASVLVGDKTIKLSKNLYISVNVENFDKDKELYNLSVNDDVVFYGRFKSSFVFGEDSLYEYAYKNNFDYRVYVDESNVVLYDKNPVGLDAVREHIHYTLYSNMDSKYASLAYSVLVGDRSGLDDELEANLKASGVGHLVAVSGLHVGFLVALMLLFCKLCRIKKGWVQFLLTSGVLILYCLLCNMTPSVTRATIMAIALLSAKAFRKQPDSLSSLSLAGIIILCVHPLYVFDISFQLSFASVFAIILLMPVIGRVYRKIKHKKIFGKALDILNLSFVAQLGTMPFIMKAFGYISVFSLLVNIIIVPLFGIVYMMLFVFTMLVCLIPFVGHLLYLPQLCFVGMDYITSFVASIPVSVLMVGTILPITLLLWQGVLFVASDKFLAKKWARLGTFASLLLVVVLTTVFTMCL